MATLTHVNMKTRKKRPSQTGELVGVRFQPALLEALDEWRRKQAALPGRAEAVRNLVQQALVTQPKKKG